MRKVLVKHLFWPNSQVGNSGWTNQLIGHVKINGLNIIPVERINNVVIDQTKLIKFISV